MGQTSGFLLEYADLGDLETYWSTTPPPLSDAAMHSLWYEMLQLSHAVKYLHNIPFDPAHGNKKALTGWHKDIQPRSILVTTHPGSTSGIRFNLADFGLGHFSFLTPGDGDIVKFGNLGTRAYGDPESYQAETRNTTGGVDLQLADVWSLGCVYSEALVWSVYGYPELERYRLKRLLEASKIWISREERIFMMDMLLQGWSRINSNDASVLASSFTEGIAVLPSGKTRLAAKDDH
ncbi:hypothetical protein S40285_05744 [Stachybotrys chlorohalonatus IBT 40285]|uniref:Protein kinase domain-containing protein n=1 Tax=Stachybotrys chlorohalonatus (strain IBT 40285) TaxID=1283841 RepID=A0A084QSL2_STAC4|nr:hypothetical protein S40285_05744 [Stachybotrys chlorohalonata IBT 40285]